LVELLQQAEQGMDRRSGQNVEPLCSARQVAQSGLVAKLAELRNIAIPPGSQKQDMANYLTLLKIIVQCMTMEAKA
jgi:hypothetical protein